MAEYEPLRISVGLNTDTAVKDAQKLGRDVQATLNKINMGELDSKTLAFVKNLTNASNRMQRLARDMEELSKTKIPTEEFKAVEKQIDKDTAALNKLIEKMEFFKETGGDTKSTSFRKMSAQADELRDSIEHARGELKYMQEEGTAFTSGKNTQKYKDMAANLNSANQATNLLLQKYAELVQADEEVSDGNENVSDSMDEVSESEDKATKSAGKYGRTLGEVGKSILKTLKNALNKMISAYKALARHMTHAHKSQNNFSRSLRQFLGYALGIRGLFSLLGKFRSYITEAFKVMAQEIGEVNTAISTMGTSFKELKASFGTAFQPILQALAPLINSLIQKLVSLMNHVARFFATLTGQNYIYEATVANYDYAKSVDEAKKANEGALASFDKLNVISKKNTDNTLALTKDTVTYKKVEINPDEAWYTRLAKKIIEGWKKADLSEATHDIAEKLATMLDDISWDDINKKSTKFAKTLASGINGITMPDEKTGKSHLAESIGNTIGEALQVAINTFDTIVNPETGINWDNLGLFLSTSIEAVKKTLRQNDSWRKAGEAFGHLFQGLVELGIQLFVENNILEGLGTDLSDFLSGLIEEGMKINDATGNTFIKDFGNVLSTAFINLMVEIEKFLDGSRDDLAEAVNELFQGIDLLEIAKHVALVFIKGLKTGLTLLLSAGLGALGITVDGDTAELLAEALGIGLLGVKIGSLVKNITGSGGLLSAFKKKDKGLQDQSRALGLETVAVAALVTGLGWLIGKAGETSWGVNALTLEQLENLGVEKDLKDAVSATAQEFEGLATAGADAAESLKQETTEALKDVDAQFKSTVPTLNPIDTSAYSTFLAQTRSTVTETRQLWQDLFDYVSQGQAGTLGNKTPQTTHGSVPGKTTEKSVSFDSEGNPVVSTGKPVTKSSTSSQGTFEGAPYYELTQKAAEVQKNSIAQKNYDNFVYTLTHDLSESESAALFAVFCKLAREAGYNEFQDVFGDNNAYTNIMTQIRNSKNKSSSGTGAKNLALARSMGYTLIGGSFIDWIFNQITKTDWLESLSKAMQTFFKWVPSAAGSLSGLPIPFFAQGAVVPPTMAPFLAVMGDNKKEAEVVSPLSTIEQAVRNVLAQQNINVTFDVKGDPNKIFKVVQRQAKSYNKRTHGEAFGGA